MLSLKPRDSHNNIKIKKKLLEKEINAKPKSAAKK
jgi:hypothetical protein